MNTATFGERLKLRRKAKLMAQEQLEAASGVSQSVISSLENGTKDSDGLSSGLLFNLCHVLECNPIWLMTGASTEDMAAMPPGLVRLIDAANGLTQDGIEALIATAKAIKR